MNWIIVVEGSVQVSSNEGNEGSGVKHKIIVLFLLPAAHFQLPRPSFFPFSHLPKEYSIILKEFADTDAKIFITSLSMQDGSSSHNGGLDSGGSSSSDGISVGGNSKSRKKVSCLLQNNLKI